MELTSELRDMLKAAYTDGYHEAIEDWEINPQIEEEINRLFQVWLSQNRYFLKENS